MEREGQKEREVELREWFVEKGITYVLFDMDGTLIDTPSHFLTRMHTYCDFLAQKSGITENELFDVFMDGIISLRDEFNVQPTVLDVPARVLAKMCGIEGDELEKEIDELMSMYETAPEVFPEAVNQVRVVRDAGMDMAVVTQAAEPWTRLKSKYFPGLFKDYVCTPTDKPKNIEAWMRGMEKIKAIPEEVMIVGDSWTSDILPALEMGAKMVVWIRNGEDPKNHDGVIEIETIADLTETLLMN